MCLDKNPEDRWTHVRLAEVYAYGTYPCLDHTEGEKLFQECERRWPDSSMVLHKFGKYYALVSQSYHHFQMDMIDTKCLQLRIIIDFYNFYNLIL